MKITTFYRKYYIKRKRVAIPCKNILFVDAVKYMYDMTTSTTIVSDSRLTEDIVFDQMEREDQPQSLEDKLKKKTHSDVKIITTKVAEQPQGIAC